MNPEELWLWLRTAQATVTVLGIRAFGALLQLQVEEEIYHVF